MSYARKAVSAAVAAVLAGGAADLTVLNGRLLGLGVGGIEYVANSAFNAAPVGIQERVLNNEIQRDQRVLIENAANIASGEVELNNLAALISAETKTADELAARAGLLKKLVDLPGDAQLVAGVAKSDSSLLAEMNTALTGSSQARARASKLGAQRDRVAASFERSRAQNDAAQVALSDRRTNVSTELALRKSEQVRENALDAGLASAGMLNNGGSAGRVAEYANDTQRLVAMNDAKDRLLQQAHSGGTAPGITAADLAQALETASVAQANPSR